MDEINEESNLSAAGSVDSAPSHPSVLSSVESFEEGDAVEDSAPVIETVTATTPAPRTLNRLITLDVTHKAIQPEDVIEYEWPHKSGDKWFIQEQIGELLDIKSFSRKFPDLTRRKVEIEERDHLLNVCHIDKKLNETQLRDMTAMRAVEIHELMSSHYSNIYMEYKKAYAAREKAIMAEKAKEMEAIKNDSKKLAELRSQAIKNAVDFNKDLQHARRNERKHFWDIQTNIIQSRTNTWKKLPAELTRPHPYAVALIPGQFQSYYRKFNRDELMRLPLSTIVDGAHLYPVHRDISPPPLSLAERDAQRLEGLQDNGVIKQEPNPIVTPRAENNRKSQESVDPSDASDDSDPKCDLCGLMAAGEVMTCASCGGIMHVSCLEMTEEMLNVVRTYDWNCVECRKCTVCNLPDREEQILFCDRCDRGYHTFCVGLKQAPQGAFVCTSFCNPEKGKNSRNSRAASRRSSVIT